MDREQLKRIVGSYYARFVPKLGRTLMVCAACGKPTLYFDLHEALVKRSAVIPEKQDLIFCVENCAPLCRGCHVRVGQTVDTALKCLTVITRRVTAERVGKWYISLWQEHEIPVNKGFLRPIKMVSVAYALGSLLPAGAELTGLELPANAGVWTINPGAQYTRDFRALCVLYWQGRTYKKRSRPPVEWAGYSRESVVRAINEGYWYSYLVETLSLTNYPMIGDGDAE